MAGLGVPGAGERGEQSVAAGVELLGGHLLGKDAVQRGQLCERGPLGAHPDLVGAERARGVGEVGRAERGDGGRRATPSRRSARARYCGRDAHPGGDHQPAREPSLVAGQADLLVDRSSGKRCGDGVSGAEGPGSADGRRPRARPGLGQFGGVGVHQVLGLGGEDARRTLTAAPTAPRSPRPRADTPRPASRWPGAGRSRVDSIDACPAWAWMASNAIPASRSRVKQVCRSW